MILETLKVLDVQRVGDLDEGIKAGITEESLPFVFELVSNRLYSNPIGSLIREITSNCFDSHIEAGVDDPVIIKKGYDSDEGFYIEFIDVGVGMSPERIRTIYMNYFSSSKRDNNNQIGGFGIGSKTPLAYTNLFYVTTIYNNIKYEYILHKGENKPTLEPLNEEETDKHNGTTIKIIMERKDTSKFAVELVNQLTYFDNVWIENWAINNDYDIYEGKYFKFRSDISQSNTFIHICIGKVRYDIDFAEVDVDSKFRRIPIAVKFDIGELKVTPSREMLRYDAEGIKLIKERIKLATDEIIEIFKDQNPVIDDLTLFVRATKNSNPRITFDEQKEHYLYIWAYSGISKSYKFGPIADLNIKETPDSLFFMWEIVGSIVGGVYNEKDRYYNREVENELIITGRYLILDKDDRISKYTNLYVYERMGSDVTVIQRKTADFSVATRKLGLKDTVIGGVGNIGKAKTLIQYLKIIDNIVKKEERMYSYYRPTDEWINTYKRSVIESSAAWKRRKAKKIFVRDAASSFRGEDISVGKLISRTGILVYGFKEDRILLQNIYNNVTSCCKTKKINTQYLDYSEREKAKKAFKVIQISKSVEELVVGGNDGPQKTIYCTDFLETKFMRKIETAGYIYDEMRNLGVTAVDLRGKLIKDFDKDYTTVKNLYVNNYSMLPTYRTKNYIPEMIAELEKFKAKHVYYIPLLAQISSGIIKLENEFNEIVDYLKFKGFRLKNEYYLKSSEQLEYEKGVRKILQILREPNKEVLLLEYKPLYIASIDPYVNGEDKPAVSITVERTNGVLEQYPELDIPF